MSGAIDRFRLDGRVVLVTGASSGLGTHFARLLADAGARVAVAARRASIEARLAQLDEDMTRVVRDQAFFDRQLQDARKATQGFTAAVELAEREAEFSEARRQLPMLKQARQEAGTGQDDLGER